MINLIKNTKQLSFDAKLVDEVTLTKLECIHYVKEPGVRSSFMPELMGEIKNGTWCKPDKGGLWTSPVGSDFGWKEWCEAEDFRECNKENSFTVKFKDDAKVIIIDSFKDLDALPSINPFIDKMPDKAAAIFNDRFPDFEKLSKEIDAIWLTEEGQWKTRMTYPKSLYGWDCESVLILNPDSIYQID